MRGESADKTLVILSEEIATPPVSRRARRGIGFLIRKLQQGLQLEMPHSRPMPSVGRRCHELRVNDADQTWRIIYRTDPDTILVAALFSKKTRKTPKTRDRPYQETAPEVRRGLKRR